MSSSIGVIAPQDVYKDLGSGTPKSVGEIGVRIAIVGDSMAAQSALYDEMWPTVLERVFNQNGVPAVVRSFSVNSHTAFRALNTASFGPLTCAQAAIAFNPSVVLVPMGFNDAWGDVDSRTSAQVNADILELLRVLRKSLPTALVYYVDANPYDRTNFTPGTLRNKGAPPQSWNLTTAGILQTFYTPEWLETTVTAAVTTSATRYDAYTTAARASTSIDGTLDIQAWKVARLGTLTTDGLHFGRYGHTLLAGYVLKGLVSSAKFLASAGINYAPQIVSQWVDPDAVFNENLTPSGTGYLTANPPLGQSEVPTTNQSVKRAITPDSWFQPYKFTHTLRSIGDPAGGNVSLSATGATGMYYWAFRNAVPNTAIFLSVDGAAFFAVNESTDNQGEFSSVALMGPLATLLGLGLGAHVFRFRVGTSATAPVTLTFIA